MSKRLILVLALAFVVGIAFAAYAEVQNVKVSGDITAYGIARNLTLRDSKGYVAAAASQGWDKSLASIARVRIDADLTDNVMTTVRLLNERYWGAENENVSGGGEGSSTVNLDLAYVTLKEFLYSPLTLTVGRQELHFGSEMIVGDPDTNNAVTTASAFSGNRRDADLSARKAFDAVRITLNYDPLVIDAIMSKVEEVTTYPDDDTDLYGINANYALNKTTTVEGYWFLKQNSAKTVGTTKKNDSVHTIGARVAAEPRQNLNVSLEGAFQLGQYYVSTNPETADRRAWAAEAAVGYTMKKMKYTPSLTLMAAYFSGDSHIYSGDRKHYRAWDPMYENQKMGDIANALFPQSNATIVGVKGSAKPIDDITVTGEYYAFLWNKPYPEGHVVDTSRDSNADLVMTTRKQAGQEFDLTATYDYTEDVQFSLLYGLFVPGSSFNKNNRNACNELIGSMKVTF